MIDEAFTVHEHVQNKERKLFFHLIHKFEHELEMLKQTMPTAAVPQPRLDLLEVFCGDDSQLCHQCQQLGYRSQRMGLMQGDLQTIEGRRELLQTLVTRRPRNVWFSPVCGPWSGWSHLNGSISLEAFDQLSATRLKHLEQIALGIVLLRYQRQQVSHLHWEQPQPSLMFKLPYLSELYAYTVPANFDMCTAGNLRDPVNNKHIRKSLTVMTTSTTVATTLSQHKCRGLHEHQVIEGTTKVNGITMNRSTYTESYPRKFARMIVQVMCKLHLPREKPVALFMEQEASTLVGEPLAKRRRLFVAARPKPARSSEVTMEMKVKRRKLTGKQTPGNCLDILNKVFDQVDNKLPRVGRRAITEPEIVQDLQELFHDKQIKAVVACRGTNRTMPPPLHLTAEEAPYRRCAYMARGTTKIYMEDEWEDWSHLSQRQLVRPSHASRISITVFPANPDPISPEPRNSGAHPETTQDSMDEIQQRSDPQSQPTVPAPDTGNARDADDLTHDTTRDHDEVTNDPETLRNGLKHLPKDEQMLIIKSHQNLGHPSPEKLSAILRQQGFRAEVSQAALQYECTVCIKHKQPKQARPGTLREDSDFNDRISVDGVSWKNSQGQQFHLYHVIDWSTNFHAAVIAPSKTTESMIQCLGQMWFSWAGLPGELMVDAGSEFNSEDFMTFLQSSNIKTHTISPEAHYQNGKIERHGAVLQTMLSKFDMEHPVQNYHDLQNALWWCVQAKNASSIRRGYAPEVLVLGKHTKLPGSVTSDHMLPAHALADSETAQGLQFRKQLAYRECARRAFHAADNDAALRKALLRQGAPHRGWYQPGEWVMVWKPISNVNNSTSGTWVGPMKVVVHESQRTVWTTMSSKLFRAAPENVRPVTSSEAQDIIVRADEPRVSDIAKQIPHDVTGDITQYHDFTNNSTSQTTADPVPQSPPINTIPDDNPPPIENPIPSSPSSNSQNQPDQEPENESPNIPEEAPVEPVNIPVPDDGELVSVGLYCTDVDADAFMSADVPLVWRQEVTITEDDIHNWRLEDDPTELSFLVTAAKKQRAEVKLGQLTAQEKAEFDKTKSNEVQNWLKTGTVERILRSKLDPSQIMRCRWILSWKPIEPSDRDPQHPTKDKKAKARLVVLGYLDPNITEIPRDSPTLNRRTKLLLLQMIASCGWDLRSFDVKAAFLQGKPQEGRILGLEPVPELAKAMGLSSQEVCRLTKGAYGLVDAPYMWFQALRSELLKLGFQQSPFDPCMFALRNPDNNQLDGVLGIHVDDGIGGGNARFASKIRELEKVYPFGSQKMIEFVFTGIEMQQLPNKAIRLSQSEYVRKINPIVIPSDRRER